MEFLDQDVNGRSAPIIRPAHAATMMESSQLSHEIDTTINLCTEGIWRSSNGTTSLVRDTYAFQVACLEASYARKIVRSHETCTTEPSWRSHSTTVGKDYQGVWDMSKFQCSSTTLSSLATASRHCFQLQSGTWPNVDWKKEGLHFFDIDTGFNSAIFMLYQTVEAVWDAFVTCWESLYIGFPMTLRVDKGRAFTSVRWTNRPKEVGTNVQKSDVGAHNWLGSGERYHAPLRRIFFKIWEEHPDMGKNIILKLAVKAMNDTMDPEGLVPSYLEFGCILRFPQQSLHCQRNSRESTLWKQFEVRCLSSQQNFEFEKLSRHALQETRSLDWSWWLSSSLPRNRQTIRWTLPCDPRWWNLRFHHWQPSRSQVQ